MADFVQNSQTKNAVRILASPIADVAAFNLIVQSVITDNPFACVAYMTAGTNHAPVERPGNRTPHGSTTRTGMQRMSAPVPTGSTPSQGSAPG